MILKSLIIATFTITAMLPFHIHDSLEHTVKEDIQYVEDGVRSIVYKSQEKIRATKKELDCLAKNIYYESRSEPYEGKIAVAHVTLNRLRAGHWGNDICRVVFAKSQFSWTLERNLKKPFGESWNQSIEAAYEAINGYRVNGLEEAQYYHANYIRRPSWARSKQKVQEVGKHIFYI